MAKSRRPSPDAPMDKTNQVVSAIRERIIQGALTPGDRLPTWVELERHFSVGRVTVMRAMSKLRRDGFVRSDSTRGTFVADRLPHLNRYALLFPTGPDSDGWSRLWWMIARRAAAITNESQKHVEIFYGVSDDPENESHQRLLAELRAHRFAGVIFAGKPTEISRTVTNWPAVPKVVVGTAEIGHPRVYPDFSSFYQRAARRFQQAGVRRVALIVNANAADYAGPALAAAGVNVPEHWRFAVHIKTRTTAGKIARLLMERPAADRPEGLLVCDDNLVPSVLSGVVQAGVRCPDELRIIAEANFPCEESSVVPIERLGFRANRLLEIAIESIDAQRRGERVEQVTLLPAEFEDECDESEPSAAEPLSVVAD